MKNFLQNFLRYPLSSQCLTISFFLATRWRGYSNNSCLLTLLLILFPLLASPISAEDVKENEYYPLLNSSDADELYIIKRNYYRYGKELKILADERIKEIKE